MDNRDNSTVPKQYSCPHCGALLETEQVLDGTQVNCPVCGGLFVATSSAPGKMADTTNPKSHKSIKWIIPVLVVGAVCVLLKTVHSEPNPGTKKTIPLSGGGQLTLVWCPPGAFKMGSPESEAGRFEFETEHLVKLTQGFWIGETEVTQGLWREVMGANPSHFKDGDNYPVESVSWWDCQAFVKALNDRYGQERMRWALPTEAQWEYACRAGTQTAYFWGNALCGDKANCDGDEPCGTTTTGPVNGKTTPVGSYAPNAWGLYDMHGNVGEWCADWVTEDVDLGPLAVRDPEGPSTGPARICRGGSWQSGARHCRSAARGGTGPGDSDDDLGLRVVLLPVH